MLNGQLYWILLIIMIMFTMFFPNLFCIVFSLMCISITLVFLKALITFRTSYYCTLFVCKTCENITNWLVHFKCHFPNTHIYIPLFIFYGFIVFVCETCYDLLNTIYTYISVLYLYLSIHLSIYIYIYIYLYINIYIYI